MFKVVVARKAVFFFAFKDKDMLVSPLQNFFSSRLLLPSKVYPLSRMYLSLLVLVAVCWHNLVQSIDSSVSVTSEPVWCFQNCLEIIRKTINRYKRFCRACQTPKCAVFYRRNKTSLKMKGNEWSGTDTIEFYILRQKSNRKLTQLIKTE